MTCEMFVRMIREFRRAGRNGATVKSLAESLDMSTKTVRRSIDEMCELGLPILYEESEFGAKVYSLRREDIVTWIDQMSRG